MLRNKIEFSSKNHSPDPEFKWSDEELSYPINENKIHHVIALSMTHILLIGEYFIKVWSLTEKSFISDFSNAISKGIFTFGVLSNGKFAILNSDDTLNFWDPITGKYLFNNKGDRAPTLPNTFAPDTSLGSPEHFASIPTDNIIVTSCNGLKLWNEKTGQLLKIIAKSTGILLHLSGTKIAYCASDNPKVVCVLDIISENDRCVFEIKKNDVNYEYVRKMRVLSDNTLMVLAGYNNFSTNNFIIQIFNIETGEWIKTIAPKRESGYMYYLYVHMLPNKLLICAPIIEQKIYSSNSIPSDYMPYIQTLINESNSIIKPPYSSSYKTIASTYRLSIVNPQTEEILRNFHRENYFGGNSYCTFKEESVIVFPPTSLPDNTIVYGSNKKLNFLKPAQFSVIQPSFNTNNYEQERLIKQNHEQQEKIYELEQQLNESIKENNNLQKAIDSLNQKNKNLINANEHNKNIVGTQFNQIQQLAFENSELQKSLESLRGQFSNFIAYSELGLGDEIGRGSYATVYKGIWCHIDVAVKKLYLLNPVGPALEEFHRETQLMAKLRSPHIVQFYGICNQNTSYYIVMEYMALGSLYDVLRRQLPYFWEDIREKIALDIICGIFFLHKKNIIHRDLKSLNVLLDENYRAKLTDFGLAKIKADSQTMSSSANSAIVGTARWMAPELNSLYPQYTYACDIYSYGMVLWELITQRLPFTDANVYVIPGLVAGGAREVIPVESPPRIAHLIRSCWEGQSNKRPTAEKIINYLKNNEPLEETKVYYTQPPNALY